MKMIRLLPLLCGLLCGVYLVTTVPEVAEARRRRKRKRKKSRKVRKKAKRIFKQAQKQYRLGRFVRALKLYEKAYELLPLPGFLYNIAQCHRMGKNYERALFFYKSYLSAQSSARNRGMVMILIAKCEKKMAMLAKAQRDAAAQKRADALRLRAERLARLKARIKARGAAPRPYLPPPRPKSKPLVKKWWFWTSIGGGVAALVVTGVLVGLLTTSSPGKWPSSSLGLLDRR